MKILYSGLSRLPDIAERRNFAMSIGDNLIVKHPVLSS